MSWGYSGNCVLTYRPRLKIWKSGGAVRFDPATFEADSYRWCFVRKINGLVVFNNYNYSRTTNSHQWAMREVLRKLKIKIDLEVDTRESLTSGGVGFLAVESEIKSALLLGQFPAKPDFRQAERVAKAMGVKFTAKLVAEINEALEIEQAEAYLVRAFEYQNSKLAELVDRLTAGSKTPNVFNGDRLPEVESTESTSEVFPCAA